MYPRDVQEGYLNYIMKNESFQKFEGLISNAGNIHFLPISWKKRMILHI